MKNGQVITLRQTFLEITVFSCYTLVGATNDDFNHDNPVEIICD